MDPERRIASHVNRPRSASSSAASRRLHASRPRELSSITSIYGGGGGGHSSSIKHPRNPATTTTMSSSSLEESSRPRHDLSTQIQSDGGTRQNGDVGEMQLESLLLSDVGVDGDELEEDTSEGRDLNRPYSAKAGYHKNILALQAATDGEAYIRPTQGLKSSGRTALAPNMENLGGRLMVMEEQQNHRVRMNNVHASIDCSEPWSYRHGRSRSRSSRPVSATPGNRKSRSPSGHRSRQSQIRGIPGRGLGIESNRDRIPSDHSYFPQPLDRILSMLDQFSPSLSDDIFDILNLQGQDREVFHRFVDFLIHVPSERARQMIAVAALKDASERVLLQCYSGPHGKVVSHEDSNSGGMISKDGVDEQDTDMIYGDDMEGCDDANLDDRETNVIDTPSSNVNEVAQEDSYLPSVPIPSPDLFQPFRFLARDTPINPIPGLK